MDFHCGVILHTLTHVNFRRVKKIEKLFERPRAKVKVSEAQLLRVRTTFHTFASILFPHVKITRQWKSALKAGTTIMEGHKNTLTVDIFQRKYIFGTFASLPLVLVKR